MQTGNEYEQDPALQVLENTHQEGPPVRFGLIGAGSLATRSLAPAIHAARGASLHAVAARQESRAAALEPATVYDDYAALIADDDVEVVYVALNNAGHLEWTLAALEAGKHVLCEKPLGMSESDVQTMIDASRRADRLLVEAFWYRWHPRTLRLERLLTSGALGEISRVEADFSYAGAESADPAQQYRYDPDGGGGALYDVGCYALSFAHMVFGASGRDLAVTSAEARIGPTGVDLNTVVHLAGPSPGHAGTATARSGIAGTDHQQADAEGSQGTASFGDPAFTSLFTPSELVISEHGSDAVREQFDGTDPYRLMVESLATRVRGEAAFLVDLRHTAAIARSADAAFAAIRRSAPGGQPS